MVKCIIYFLTFLLISKNALSQNDSVPLYRQFPTVPVFKLMRSDSTYFQLKEFARKRKQPVVIIVFSPTCGHCQHQAAEITAHMNALKNITFIFSTPYSVDEMKSYTDAYGLYKFSNIIIGHDKGYILGTFYKITNMPGIFVYDKKGNLLHAFDTNITTKTLLDTLKQ